MKVMFYLALCLVPLVGHTQRNDDGPLIEELRWVDNGYLQRQRQLVDEIARGEWGQRIRGDRSDLHTLNRILENGLVGQTEKQKLQALGVALGDVFVSELNLQWRAYHDEEGKSRAVCLPDTTHCLFPITMISRRMEAGRVPDAQELYDTGAKLMQPYLPKLPYSKR